MSERKPVGGKDREDEEAVEYMENMKGLHMNWISFLVVVPCLYLLQGYVTPDENWVMLVAGAWGLAIALHALVIYGLFSVFDTKWEQRQIDKRKKR